MIREIPRGWQVSTDDNHREASTPRQWRMAGAVLIGLGFVALIIAAADYIPFFALWLSSLLG